MRVTLLYFGVLKDLLGAEGQEMEAPEGATVGDLLRIVRERTSNVRMEAEIWQSVAVAVNRQYEPAERVLRNGDEVALLPPVSGGSFAEGERRASLARANASASAKACAMGASLMERCERERDAG